MSAYERWVPVVGFEDCYEVSSLGRMRSLDRVIARKNGTLQKVKGRLMRPCRDSRGYPTVSLTRAGIGHRMRVHVIVLTAFVGPPPPGHECLHRNDIKYDNRLCNLRWGTRSENQQDAERNGRAWWVKRYSGPALQMELLYETEVFGPQQAPAGNGGGHAGWASHTA